MDLHLKGGFMVCEYKFSCLLFLGLVIIHFLRRIGSRTKPDRIKNVSNWDFFESDQKPINLRYERIGSKTLELYFKWYESTYALLIFVINQVCPYLLHFKKSEIF